MPPGNASAPQATPAAPSRRSQRISAIDWMRGFVMILMVIDHASMAFDGFHVAKDSALYSDAATMVLPAGEFFTRWITHLCAPTFVFLAGTALALSVERRVARGANAWDIDRNILVRGGFIALLDPTIISLGSGRLTLQVLLAIGLAMMCMAPLRRLPTWALLSLGLGWVVLGEGITRLFWHPPGSASIPAALTVATYGSEAVVIKYPLVPWLALMVLGWVFGRHINEFSAGRTKISPRTVMWVAGGVNLLAFAIVRALPGYGDMFLQRTDASWEQWLHVSKYPPSLAYYGLEGGLMCLCLAAMMSLERVIGVRPNGVLLVFGQTAMFFYLVHRLGFEVPASYLGLRGAGDMTTTYLATAVMLVLLYPACRWYRSVKDKYPDSVLKFI